jgi:hypothetical protein
MILYFYSIVLFNFSLIITFNYYIYYNLILFVLIL